MLEKKIQIKSWQDFHRHVKPKGCNLFKRLDEFPNSILISGCQRSGTTMLSRLITESDGMINYWISEDDELDAALILSGVNLHQPAGRYCFQTTYLNDCYHEYFNHKNGHKIAWVIRNPFSVIYSMLYNWGRPALNNLFQCCGSQLVENREETLLTKLGISRLGRLEKACYAYNGKTEQAFELQEKLDKQAIIFIEYDELVANKHTALPALYDFLSIPYKNEYAEKVHQKSVKKADKLSSRERDLIEQMCVPVYTKAVTTLIRR